MRFPQRDVSRFLPFASLGLAGWLCCSLSGCLLPKYFSPKEFGWATRCALPADATKEEIITRLNQSNSGDPAQGGLYSWESSDIRIQLAGPLPVMLSGTLAVQSPSNLRLRIAHPLAGGDAFDLGSNEEQMWMWTSENNPENVILTARHDELQNIPPDVPLPFQPSWLMEVLGVIPIDPDRVSLQRPSQGSRIAELVSEDVSPQGQPVRKVITIDTCHGLPLKYQLFDETGHLIAQATLSQHRTDPQSNLILARHIDVRWPATGMSMAMSIRDLQLNSDSIPPTIWELPRRPGSRLIDLAAHPGNAAPRERRRLHQPVMQVDDSGTEPDAELLETN